MFIKYLIKIQINNMHTYRKHINILLSMNVFNKFYILAKQLYLFINDNIKGNKYIVPESDKTHDRQINIIWLCQPSSTSSQV